jgi:chromosome segregation ATPase
MTPPPILGGLVSAAALGVAASVDLTALGIVGSFLAAITGAYVAVARTRRLLGTEVEGARAAARKAEAEAGEIEERVSASISERVDRLQAQVLDARAAQADAVQQLLAVQTEYARAQANAYEQIAERDRTIAELRERITANEATIAELQAHVETLQARLGMIDRREANGGKLDGGRRETDGEPC